MLPVVSLLLLSLAVSLDGFGVGVMYGLRKIRIPFLSVAIISFCSGMIIYASMQIGVLMSRFVDPAVAKSIGALILMGIGFWAIFQMITEKVAVEEGPEENKEAGAHELFVLNEKAAAGTKATASASTNAAVTAKEILYIELKRFGLVIQIFRTPSMADMDRSGNISSYEAMLLGIALSLDAFGAGIGAALLGFTPWLTAAAIALSSGTFLGLGLSFGFRFAELKWIRKLSILPGFVLIIMGIMKLL